MEILSTNPKTGNPIFNIGEYKDVLSVEQTLNFENISKYVKSAVDKGDEAELNAALENIYKQPIMAAAYRKAGIRPEQVEEYIQSRKKLPQSAKTADIINLGAFYGIAASDMEAEYDLRISGDREWRSLERSITSSVGVTVPMKKFVEQKAAEGQPQEQKKSGWDKIAGLLKLKNGGRKL